MIVDDFAGVHQVHGDAEMEAVLAARCARREEIWISHDGLRFPAILIMANRDLARVPYFPEEFDPGYQSVGQMPDLGPKGSTSFRFL